MRETAPQPNSQLIQARKNRHWTQQQLADELQIGVDSLRGWERGRHFPSPSMREKLCALFALSPEELGLGSEETCEQPILPSKQDDKNRRLLIGRVRNTWIEGVLKTSLHRMAMMELGMQEQPDALANPWRLAVQETNLPAAPLPPGTSLLHVYDEADGQVLLLGEPGAGKTTLLLELAEKLLMRAGQDGEVPLPVIFNLASWSPRHASLGVWLIEELQNKYRVPEKLARKWVETNQLILLLDGLDETAEEARALCVRALNTYQQEHALIPMVVCCRSGDYFAQAALLDLQRAVVIQPLGESHIDAYFLNAGPQLVMVREALREDPELREMVKTPLMLSVVTLAYQGKVNIVLTGSIEEQRQQIFAQYVQTMLARRSVATYPVEQTIHWLARLAEQMKKHHQSVFYLERIQPDWLVPAQRQKYRRLVTWVLCGFAAFLYSSIFACFRGDFIPNEPGLFFWVGGGRGNSVLGWMASGIGAAEQGATSLCFLFVVVVSLTSLLADKGRIPAFSRELLWPALQAGLRWALKTGGILSLVCGLIFGWRGEFTHIDHPLLRAVFGMCAGLFIGICFGFQMILVGLFRSSAGKREKKPSTFTLKDRLLNSGISFCCGFLGFAAVYSWEAGGVDSLALAYGLVAGGIFGVIFSRGDEPGFVRSLGTAIRPAEATTWSWPAVFRGFLSNLKNASILALILSISVGSIITGFSSLFYGVSYGLPYGLIYGSVIGIKDGQLHRH